MRMIGKNWLQSLSGLHPLKLLSFFKQTALLFLGALHHLIVNFGWLIIVHAILFCLFGELISKIITTQGELIKTSSPGIHILTLVQSVLWFLITSAFLLIIRKSDSLDIKSYFRIFFFKYIQLLFFASLIAFIFLYLLIIGGITKIPSAPWTLTMTIKIIELSVVFYWLDSRGQLINLAISLERAINFVFYNIPFLLFLFGILWVFDYGISLAAGKIIHLKPAHLLFSQTIPDAVGESLTRLTIIKTLGVKYLAVFIEHFWVALLFVLYRKKCSFLYSSSLFEKSCE